MNNYNTHMNSAILSFYLLTNRIWVRVHIYSYSIYLRIEYELEFIFPHRNSTILSFHHIYYLLFTIYSRIFSNIPSYSLIWTQELYWILSFTHISSWICIFTYYFTIYLLSFLHLLTFSPFLLNILLDILYTHLFYILTWYTTTITITTITTFYTNIYSHYYYHNHSYPIFHSQNHYSHSHSFLFSFIL